MKEIIESVWENRKLLENPNNSNAVIKTIELLDKGEIRIGYDADLTIVDMKKKFKISNEWIQSKSKWTPYELLVCRPHRQLQ